jgi:hypothetical protein
MPPEQVARILPVSAPLPTRVAMALPAISPQAMLPETAGPLPWFAVTGLLSLIGGLGLTLSRRFSDSRT